MPYNGASNGSGGVGGAVAGSSVSGGGATIVVSEGPQNKKIRTGVQAGDNDVTMHSRVSAINDIAHIDKYRYAIDEYSKSIKWSIWAI